MGGTVGFLEEEGETSDGSPTAEDAVTLLDPLKKFLKGSNAHTRWEEDPEKRRQHFGIIGSPLKSPAPSKFGSAGGPLGRKESADRLASLRDSFFPSGISGRARATAIGTGPGPSPSCFRDKMRSLRSMSVGGARNAPPESPTEPTPDSSSVAQPQSFGGPKKEKGEGKGGGDTRGGISSACAVMPSVSPSEAPKADGELRNRQERARKSFLRNVKDL
eukprot:Cvel_7260.t2-p1 / transcript=Cvel_7260.t2 / gene=Cvel_7260 / organism=Chromera_velia_CCMP2878 / gene_product=Calcium/calmodulin-dependent 3',5'-cyclic, putative / transcript_product=Calcium/calmodulin-dependent 3',5'-cyclic, putative / location=Cvel_scaffold375:19723-21419(+) / protein_length=217 / sequence_SO=supercontig / SO=protein_coding / is_pseudo=false